MNRIHKPHRTYVYHDPDLRGYGAKPPFSPGKSYPEYPFADAEGGGENTTYHAVRSCFHLMGLDVDRFGTPEWNPLSEIVKPGQRVLIKPNLVMDFHGFGWSVESVITNGSVIRAVLDYVVMALQGKGKVVIGDAPLQSADFERLRDIVGLNEILRFYQDKTDIPIEVVDFRRERAFLNQRRWIIAKSDSGGDPNGYVPVDLGKGSLFAPVAHLSSRYRVTNYDPGVMTQHHNNSINEYLIARSVLEADVVISLPKMKTHRKAGITAALKNSVGINGHKDWLPHHRRGSERVGGDEYLYPSLLKMVADFLIEKEDVESSLVMKTLLRLCRACVWRLSLITAKDRFFEGSWYGNDTLWRTILDLNRILLYADATGRICGQPQRNLLFLVDGIIAGECEGPLDPTPKACGLLVAGFSAPAVDAVIAQLMGFDLRKISSVRESFRIDKHALIDIDPMQVEIDSNSSALRGLNILKPGRGFGFIPPKGWQGHIELSSGEDLKALYPQSSESPGTSYRGLRLP